LEACKEACKEAAPPPRVLACQAECLAELRQPADDLDARLAAVTAPKATPDEVRYARYAQARLKGRSGNWAEAAKLLGEAYPVQAKPFPALQKPFRVARALGAIDEAVRDWRAKAGPGRAFADGDLDAAIAALKTATALTQLPGVAPPPDQLTRLRQGLVLALRQKPGGDPALVRQLVEELVKPDVLKGLSPADTYPVLVLHVQTRDAAGRREAAESATQALELIRNDPKLVEPSQVFADLVQPILDPKADQPLLAGSDRPLRAATAKRYVTTARMIGAKIKAWGQVKGVGEQAPALVLQLFQRAIKLDDQPEYPVLQAFAAIEQSVEPDLKGWQTAADRATKEASGFAGGYILQGIVLLYEAYQPGLAPDALTAKLTQADGRFEESLKHNPKPEEKATALLCRSQAALQLANASSRRPEIDKHLKDAVGFAKDALEEDKTIALAWDAQGLALEDRAMLLNEVNEYANAVAAFSQAVGIGFGATRL
jgi:hypothetical protein